ncbi:Cys rich CPXG domain containing protein [Lysobacter dokdonensis DS-58]|uniref:Cys rich CPXG domain containing protein n=1 Tax=Lysobacter dokdonensis DS-58 TaxID=1300345 RepID=A0A0A2WJ01_9GAMM|nr:BrnA antitoxin family protein [Lysobacter dokdonensis]KGQ18230.1 Cys rich CPXG domain containing protein [Lysobacter dokdonensis DS-58]
MATDIDFSDARRGAALPAPKGKTRITIYIDDDVLDAFRDRAEAEGRGYQTAINEALRRSIATGASKHEALLARLQDAIAGVLEGVKIMEATKPRTIAKRVPRGRTVSKGIKPKKR